MRLPCVLAMLVACGRNNFDDANRDDAQGGADQDGDGTPDATDNCPAQYNTDQLDGDGDGVGDACDPHPSAPGDVLVARGLFATGFGDWVPDTIASWSLGGGQLATTGAAAATLARISVAHTLTNPTVLLGFHTLDLGTGLHHVDLTFGDAHAWLCEIYNSSGSNLLNTLGSFVDGVPNQTQYFPTAITSGIYTTVKYTHEAPEAHCSATSTTVFATAPSTMPLPTTVTVEVQDATVTFDYAMVYDAP